MGDAGAGAGSLLWLQGVWRRESRTLASQPLSEVSRVVWVQVGDWFADVRDPQSNGEGLSYLDEAQAFSGVVRWADGTVKWQHDLDTKLRTPGHEDSAVVERVGELLIERGPDYEERWRRDEQPGPVAVLERRTAGGSLTARLVSVGDVSVTVWAGRSSGGAAVRFAGDGWEVETCVGARAIPWSAVLATRSGRIPAGWKRVA
jgi:hypothetical protein